MTVTHYLTLITAILMTGLIHAEPFTPVDDNQVLEQLPVQLFQPSERTKIDRLRSRFKTNPQDWIATSELAQYYIQLAQSQADPRYMGYAQAILKPWWTTSQPSIQALVFRAIIRQNAHDFTGANKDLEQILRIQPGHYQANFIKATIATVQGDYQTAIRHCQQLIRRSSILTGLICQSTPASLSGKAENSYLLLKQLLSRTASIPEKQKLWAWTTLAEIAWRTGKFQSADHHFQTALQINARDMYARRAYADFLLQQHRPVDIVKLIGTEISNDALLLRLTLAEQMIDAPQLNHHIGLLKERFKANRQRGSSLHQGDEARFVLHLLNQPQAALQLARQNWQVQREPVDTYILLQSAIAANDTETTELIRQWLARQGTEDVLIDQILATLEGNSYEI